MIFEICRPEHAAKRQSKDLPFFLLLPVLLLATLAAPAQKTTAPRTNGQISGQAIYTLTQQYLAAAPKRYIGSPGHAKAEAFIKSHFTQEIAKGNFETDDFSARTPIGLVPMRNFIVRYPGKKDGVIVIASHYETNYPLKDIPFVGANDGACTTALLISLGA